MIWFFEKPGQRLRCEIRRADESGFELVWTAEDGRVHVARSEDPEELVLRKRALENWLRLDGWVRPGRMTPRVVLDDAEADSHPRLPARPLAS